MHSLDLTGKYVFGVALNFKALLAQHEQEFNQKPYLKPPQSPVLFVKPPVTYNLSRRVPLDGLQKLQTGANIAIVIGKRASRVRAEDALDYVRGVTVANDYSAPITSYYRPAVVAKCRDNSLSICPEVTPLKDIDNLDDLVLTLSINGVEQQRENSSNWVRSVPQLLAAITEFMTLNEGDVLLTGTPANTVFAQAGDRVEAAIQGVCTLTDEIISGE